MHIHPSSLSLARQKASHVVQRQSSLLKVPIFAFAHHLRAIYIAHLHCRSTPISSIASDARIPVRNLRLWFFPRPVRNCMYHRFSQTESFSSILIVLITLRLHASKATDVFGGSDFKLSTSVLNVVNLNLITKILLLLCTALWNFSSTVSMKTLNRSWHQDTTGTFR